MNLTAFDIYVICKLDTIQGILTGVGLVFGSMSGILYLLNLDKDFPVHFPFAKKLFIIMMIMAIIGLFMPDTRTYIAMKIGPKLLTESNVEKATEVSTGLLKSMFRAIDDYLSSGKRN